MSHNTTGPMQAVIERMFNAGAHFGYSRSRRHPSVQPFLAGVKNSTQIIDLEKTYEQLERAKAFLKTLGSEGKPVLVVGSKKEARDAAESAALRMGVSSVTERWLGGTLTNWNQIKLRVARLKDLKERKEKGELSVYTKRERGQIDKEIEKLERFFSGIARMEQIPAALVVVDSAHEDIAVAEARAKNIPVISISNADCDISRISYPIVANDAARASITYLIQELADAYIEGTRLARTETSSEVTKVSA